MNPAKLLAAYKKNKSEAKLMYYRPFTTNDTHFDGLPHRCKYTHRMDPTELLINEQQYWGHPANSQMQFHESDSLRRAIVAGNRAGKTICGAAEASFLAMGAEGERFWGNLTEPARERYASHPTPNDGWVVSRTYETQLSGAQYWLLKKGLLPRDFIADTKKKYEDKYASITLTNGSTIRFKSSEQERDAFQSAELAWIWIDEEPKNEAIYNECTMREGMNVPLSIFFTLTPVKGLTFILNRVYENPRYDIFQWSLWDNPYFDHKRVAEKETAGETEKNSVLKRIYGLFLKEQSLIFPMFDVDRHVKEPFTVPSDWDIIEVIDPGFINEAAVGYYAINPQDVIYVVDEIYEKGLTTPELCERIHQKRRSAEYSETGRWEPRYSIADPQVNEKDPDTNMTTRAMMASKKPQHGSRVLVKAANKSSAGLDTIRTWLRPGKKGPRLFVMEHCQNFIYEMKRYRRKEYASTQTKQNRNAPESPRKKDDHLMNTCKYFANESPYYVGAGGGVTYRRGTETRTNPAGRKGSIRV